MDICLIFRNNSSYWLENGLDSSIRKSSKSLEIYWKFLYQTILNCYNPLAGYSMTFWQPCRGEITVEALLWLGCLACNDIPFASSLRLYIKSSKGSHFFSPGEIVPFFFPFFSRNMNTCEVVLIYCSNKTITILLYFPLNWKHALRKMCQRDGTESWGSLAKNGSYALSAIVWILYIEATRYIRLVSDAPSH